MDVVAHMLWAAAGTAFAARRFALSQKTIVVTIVLAALPDVPQFLPLLAWSLFGQGPWAALWAHATSLPGQEPVLPALVGITSHHLHCIAHSAVIAAVVTVLLWCARRSLWFPLLGWWSHILIDVFTHSAGFYRSPVLYPLTYRGFDGVAWNEPWFMALNYAALALVGAWWRSCARSSPPRVGHRRMSDPQPRSER